MGIDPKEGPMKWEDSLGYSEGTMCRSVLKEKYRRKEKTMKSKSEIEMDFERAVSQAEELEELSKELSKIATEHVKGALRLLMVGWQGDNSELFVEKGNMLTSEMIETADDLIKVAKNIRSTANIVYTAEKAAAQLGF